MAKVIVYGNHSFGWKSNLYSSLSLVNFELVLGSAKTDDAKANTRLAQT